MNRFITRYSKRKKEEKTGECRCIVMQLKPSRGQSQGCMFSSDRCVHVYTHLYIYIQRKGYVGTERCRVAWGKCICQARRKVHVIRLIYKQRSTLYLTCSVHPDRLKAVMCVEKSSSPVPSGCVLSVGTHASAFAFQTGGRGGARHFLCAPCRLPMTSTAGDSAAPYQQRQTFEGARPAQCKPRTRPASDNTEAMHRAAVTH